MNIHFDEIRRGGYKVLLRKTRRLAHVGARFPGKLLALVLVFPVVLVVRLLRPWILIRIGSVYGAKLGHFAANVEIYLCEKDAGINTPTARYVDIFYISSTLADKNPPNEQLLKMWRRLINIWPTHLVEPLDKLNSLLPGGQIHSIDHASSADRDIHNLLDRFPPHLQFTEEECQMGEHELSRMGVPKGAPFVCLNVRDSGFWPCHNLDNYRNSSIGSFTLAADWLAERGFYVIRVGSVVNEKLQSSSQRVVDYATNGMRSAFMDIYLGAKCHFAVSTGTGWDAVPYVFRRPICYVDYVPLGILMTFRHNSLYMTKHHRLMGSDGELSLQDIVTDKNIFHSLSDNGYAKSQVVLHENTPEEILDAVKETALLIENEWRLNAGDESLQRRFVEVYKRGFANDAHYREIHGEFRGVFSTSYLKNNIGWLQG